ncbi:MAG: hypothetical protein ACI9XB_002566, partial [Gammaproteobacteria bacterium]
LKNNPQPACFFHKNDLTLWAQSITKKTMIKNVLNTNWWWPLHNLKP